MSARLRLSTMMISLIVMSLCLALIAQSRRAVRLQSQLRAALAAAHEANRRAIDTWPTRSGSHSARATQEAILAKLEEDIDLRYADGARLKDVLSEIRYRTRG